MSHKDLKENKKLPLDKFYPDIFFTQFREEVNESCVGYLPTLQLQYLIDDYHELIDSSHINKKD